MELPASNLDALVAITRSRRSAVFRRVWIHSARPDVHGVVRILVEEPERIVVGTAAAEIPERAQAHNLCHVIRCRGVIVNLLVDGGSAELSRIPQWIPQRIGCQQRIQKTVAMDSLRVLVAD